MAWPARHVARGDAVVLVAHRHWVGLVAPLGAGAAVVAAAVAAAVAGAPRPLALALVGGMCLTLVWLVARYLRWRRPVAALTTSALLVHRGLRRPLVVPLDDLRDVRLQQRRRQRLVRSADVVVEVLGGSRTTLQGVAAGAELRRQAWRHVERRRAAGGAVGGPTLAGARR